MPHKSNFANGRHIIAARTFAGLSQIELAKLSGVHRNSLSRWETMATFQGGWALERIENALRLKGVIVGKTPAPFISITSSAF